MKLKIKLLFLLIFNFAAYSQVSYECIIEQEINGNILEVSAFIRSTGVTPFKIGGANFRMNVDTSALDISIAPIELEEGLWDNNYDPTNYGDQDVGFNLLQGWVSIDIYGEGTGDGIPVPLVKTLIGKISIPIKIFNITSGINWRMTSLNSTEVIDIGINDITSFGLFIDPGAFVISGLEVTRTPSEFYLYQNYPNPFNPMTRIKFAIPEAGGVSLKIFDIRGQEVVDLVNADLMAGYYEVELNLTNLSSGTYIYRLQSNGFSDSKKLMLIK